MCPSDTLWPSRLIGPRSSPRSPQRQLARPARRPSPRVVVARPLHAPPATWHRWPECLVDSAEVGPGRSTQAGPE
eukprot:6711612-Alexandrium_andersonii.AAC.1